MTTLKMGKPATTVTELRVDGGQVGDETFTFGRDGLKVAHNGVPVPLTQGLAALNQGLAPTGISVRFLDPEPIAGGARSGVFELTSVQNTPLGAKALLRMRVGEVISGVVTAASQAADADAAPTFDSPTTSAAPSVAPPATSTEATGTSIDDGSFRTGIDAGDQAATMPASAPCEAASTGYGAAGPAAPSSTEGTVDLVASGAKPRPTGAGRQAQRLAAHALLKQELATASVHRVLGAFAFGGLLFVLVSLLWRKGVPKWLS